MDIITMAKELGKKLQQTPEYLEMIQAREKNDADEGLQELINEFNLKKIDLERKVNAGELDDEAERESNKKVMGIYNQIMATPGMAAYLAAKNNLDKITSQINSILIMSINGGDPDTYDPSSSCGSGGCGSCGGCG